MLPPAAANPPLPSTNAATWTSMPSGSRALSDPREATDVSTSPARRARRRSRYSPHRLAPRGEGQPEADERVGHEALGVGHRHAAPPERPLPHPGHVAVAGEADLALLGEAERASRRWSSGGTRASPDRDTAPFGQVLARALAPAGRRDGRGHDVFEAETGAGAAVVAGRPAAVLDAWPRPAHPASRPRGSRGAARPRCGPRAAPRAGRARWRTS